MRRSELRISLIWDRLTAWQNQHRVNRVRGGIRLRRLRHSALRKNREDWGLLEYAATKLAGLRRHVRRAYYRAVLKSMGYGCQISDGVIITEPHNVTLGNNVVLNEHVVIQSCGGAAVVLGDGVTVSYGAKILTGGLVIDSTGPIQEEHTAKSVIVERGAWVGAGAIVLPGVRIGARAVVAAGSVVTRSVDALTIVGLVPARLIGRVDKSRKQQS